MWAYLLLRSNNGIRNDLQDTITKFANHLEMAVIFFFKLKEIKMSKDTKTKDLNYYINWLERSIADENVKLYEYSDLEIKKSIGSGSYGKVYCVNWKNSNRFFALKSFVNDNQTLKEVLKEVNIYKQLFKKFRSNNN
jgi:hypothetical protein